MKVRKMFRLAEDVCEHLVGLDYTNMTTNVEFAVRELFGRVMSARATINSLNWPYKWKREVLENHEPGSVFVTPPDSVPALWRRRIWEDLSPNVCGAISVIAAEMRRGDDLSWLDKDEEITYP